MDKKEPRLIKTLVLGGGGSRGVVYVGVFKRLQQLLYSKEIDLKIVEVCGVSAGAIFGLLFTIGYTAEELEDIILNLKFKSLRTINFKQFFNKYGLDSGQKLTDFLGGLIEAKGFCKGITFEQLKQLTQINLKVVACNLNKYKLVAFDCTESPGLSVLKAVRMSIGIPGYFWAEVYKNDFYIDGGLIDSYPINFVGGTGGDTEGGSAGSNTVLGFKIVNHKIPGATTGHKITSIDSFLYHTFYCVMNHREHLQQQLEELKNLSSGTICINLYNEQLLNFDMTLQDKKRLIALGCDWNP